MRDPILDRDSLQDCLRLVAEEAADYLATVDSAPVRPPQPDAAHDIAGALPAEGLGSLEALRTLIDAAEGSATRSAGAAVLSLRDGRRHVLLLPPTRSVNGISVGDTLNVDLGTVDSGTVASVGSGQKTATTLAAAASAGDTNIKVTAVASGGNPIFVVGDKVAVDVGSSTTCLPCRRSGHLLPTP